MKQHSTWLHNKSTVSLLSQQKQRSHHDEEEEEEESLVGRKEGKVGKQLMRSWIWIRVVKPTLSEEPIAKISTTSFIRFSTNYLSK